MPTHGVRSHPRPPVHGAQGDRGDAV